MSEEGLKQRLASIQHDTLLHHAYGDELNLKSIANAKQAIIDAFKKQEKEIERLKIKLEAYRETE